MGSWGVPRPDELYDLSNAFWVYSRGLLPTRMCPENLQWKVSKRILMSCPHSLNILFSTTRSALAAQCSDFSIIKLLMPTSTFTWSTSSYSRYFTNMFRVSKSSTRSQIFIMFSHRCCRGAVACSGSHCWSSLHCTPVTQTHKSHYIQHVTVMKTIWLHVNIYTNMYIYISLYYNLKYLSYHVMKAEYRSPLLPEKKFERMKKFLDFVFYLMLSFWLNSRV